VDAPTPTTPPAEPIDPLDVLLTRFDPTFLGRRLLLQVNHFVRIFGSGRGGIHLENMDFLFPILDLGLRLCGLKARATRNVLVPRVSRRVFVLPQLPPAFAGLRVLHLSDLHIDCAEGIGDLAQVFSAALRGLAFDLCVITGDFRYKTFGSYEEVAEQMARFAPALACRHGVYAVLGNHDVVEEVPYFERLGVRMLVNEAVAVERDGQRLWLAGLDDPHFYGTHDLDRALRDVPGRDCVVALVHSPELAEEAAERGVALYLAGHTHGGQLCLPGGFAPRYDARCPRRRARGRWRVGAMEGYTSVGLGASGLPVRLNCPPEIAIHELRPAGSSAPSVNAASGPTRSPGPSGG
jgi:uncharacterized protein